jgi:hypothetical protein
MFKGCMFKSTEELNLYSAETGFQQKYVTLEENFFISKQDR